MDSDRVVIFLFGWFFRRRLFCLLLLLLFWILQLFLCWLLKIIENLEDFRLLGVFNELFLNLNILLLLFNNLIPWCHIWHLDVLRVDELHLLIILVLFSLVNDFFNIRIFGYLLILLTFRWGRYRLLLSLLLQPAESL